MFFSWGKYKEKEVGRRNTLQIFITNRCNLKCKGCFARKIMKENNQDISLKEYGKAVKEFLRKGGKQINIIGGEPLLHPQLREILDFNRKHKIKTTIYTNGEYLNNFNKKFFKDIKLRVSVYCKSKGIKSSDKIPKTDIPIEICYMVSKSTTLKELLASAKHIEKNYKCKVFFISSIRELDNPKKEFFQDTKITMNVLKYKQLVHDFLEKYSGKMEVHISKRGVFESTKTLADNKCHFANYFIGGKIIQCPYDIVNRKFQKTYKFGVRHCQHNNSCLMSKIALKKR